MAGRSSGNYGPQFSQLSSELEKAALHFTTLAGSAAAFAKSISAFRELEKQLVNTNAAAGGTAEQFKKMEESVRRFALVAKSSAAEAAQALYFLTSAGFSTSEAMSAMTGVLLLSQATMTDTSLVADTLASTLSSFNLEASEATRIANLFAASTSASQATIDKLAYSMRQVAPVASAFGISVEDTVTYLSLLYDAGLRGEQGGTSFRNIITRLADPVGEAAQQLEALDISIIKAGGSVEQLGKTLAKLKAANLSETTFSTIFGAEALAGGLVLVDKTGEEFIKLRGRITGTQKAFELASQQINTLDGSLALAQNSLNEFGIELGKAVAPYVRELALVFNEFAKTFNGLDSQTKQYIATMGGLTLALVVALPVMSLMVGTVVKLGAAFITFVKVVQSGVLIQTVFRGISAALLLVLNPIGLVIGALTLITGYFAANAIGNAADQWVRELTGAFEAGSIKPVEDFATSLRQQLDSIGSLFAKDSVAAGIDASGALASTKIGIQEARKKTQEGFDETKKLIMDLQAQAGFYDSLDLPQLRGVLYGKYFAELIAEKGSLSAAGSEKVVDSFLKAIKVNKDGLAFLNGQSEEYRQFTLDKLESNRAIFKSLAEEILAGGGSSLDVERAFSAKLQEIAQGIENTIEGQQKYQEEYKRELTRLESLANDGKALGKRAAKAQVENLKNVKDNFALFFGRNLDSLKTDKEKQAANVLLTKTTELLETDEILLKALEKEYKRGTTNEKISKLITDRVNSPASSKDATLAVALSVAGLGDSLSKGLIKGKQLLDVKIAQAKNDAAKLSKDTVDSAAEALSVLQGEKTFKNTPVLTQELKKLDVQLQLFAASVAKQEAELLGDYSAQRAADLKANLLKLKADLENEALDAEKLLKESKILSGVLGDEYSGNFIKALTGQAFKRVDGTLVDPNNLTRKQYAQEVNQFKEDVISILEKANGPETRKRIEEVVNSLPENLLNLTTLAWKKYDDSITSFNRETATKIRKNQAAFDAALNDALIGNLESRATEATLAGKAFEAFDYKNEIIRKQFADARKALLPKLMQEARDQGISTGSDAKVKAETLAGQRYAAELDTLYRNENNALRQNVIDRQNLGQELSTATTDLINSANISRLEASLSDFQTFAPSQIDKIFDTRIAIAEAQKNAKLAAIDAEFAAASNDRSKDPIIESLFAKLVADGDLVEAEFNAQLKQLNKERSIALVEAKTQFERYIADVQSTFAAVNDDIAKVFSAGSGARAAQLALQEQAAIEQRFLEGRIAARERAAEIVSKLDADDPRRAIIEKNNTREIELLEERRKKEIEFLNSETALYEFRKRAAEEQIALYERQGRAANSFFDGFTNAARKSIVEAGDLFYEFGENVFKSLGDQVASSFFGVTQSWRETLSIMAKDFVRSGLGSIIQQAFAGAVSNFSSSIGEASKDGGSSGGGLGSSVLSVLKTGFSSLTSSMFDAGSTLAKSIDGVGSFFGLNAGRSGLGANFVGPVQPGLSSAFTAGNALGGLGGNLLAKILFGSQGIGADIGGALGGIAGAAAAGASSTVLASLGSFAGPLGALGGAFLGTAVGGLFGNNKPSDKTQAGAVLLGTGQITFDKGLTGAKFSQENKDFKDLVIQYGSGLVQELIKETGSFINQQLIVEIGNRDGLRYQLGEESKKIFNTSSELLESLTKDITRVFTSLSSSSQPLIDLNTALPKIDFKDASKAVQDVLFALNYSNLTEKETKKITEAEVALKAIADRFTEVRATAERLGLSLQVVADAQAAAEKALRDGFSKSVQEAYLQAADPIGLSIAQELDKYKQQIAEAAALGVDTTLLDLTHHITIMNLLEQRNQEEVKLHEDATKALQEKTKKEIDGYKTTADAASKLIDTYKSLSKSLGDAINQLRIGSNSNLSLDQRLSEARAIFNTTSSLAALGNEDALRELPALGNQLLELSKQFNASGQGFSDDFRLVEQALLNAKTVADRQVSIQQQQLDAANQTIAVLQAGFDKLAAGGGGVGSGATLYNFNDKVVELFGSGLSKATPAIAAQLNTIFSQAAPGIVAGGGRLTSFFANDNTANQTAIALARAYGIPGFAKGGITPRGKFLVGENGPEIMSMNTSGTVRPIELGGADLVDEVKVLRMQSLDGNIEVVNAINNLNDNISQLNKKLDRAIR